MEMRCGTSCSCEEILATHAALEVLLNPDVETTNAGRSLTLPSSCSHSTCQISHWRQCRFGFRFGDLELIVRVAHRFRSLWPNSGKSRQLCFRNGHVERAILEWLELDGAEIR